MPLVLLILSLAGSTTDDVIEGKAGECFLRDLALVLSRVVLPGRGLMDGDLP